jgi:hypothetical protein
VTFTSATLDDLRRANEVRGQVLGVLGDLIEWMDVEMQEGTAVLRGVVITAAVGEAAVALAAIAPDVETVVDELKIVRRARPLAPAAG